MKIAITGHTRGLGKAIYDLYPGAVGFSKSTGYNIGNEADAISIISQSIDCDVFINNAFHETAQQHLFEKTSSAQPISEEQINTLVNTLMTKMRPRIDQLLRDKIRGLVIERFN